MIAKFFQWIKSLFSKPSKAQNFAEPIDDGGGPKQPPAPPGP